jgi:hypothetical protein
MYRDDKVASRAGMATGAMEACPTCGKPQNPKKPHNHSGQIREKSGTGLFGKAQDAIGAAAARRRRMMDKY